MIGFDILTLTLERSKEIKFFYLKGERMNEKRVRIRLRKGKVILYAESLARGGASYALEVDGSPFSSIDFDPGELNASRLSAFYVSCSDQLEKYLQTLDISVEGLSEEVAKAITEEFAE